MIYLDNASTTRIDSRVLEKMMPYLTDMYGNPGTLYRFGREAKFAVEEARIEVSKFFNCSPTEVIFTSGGSEGNNMVIKSMIDIWSGTPYKNFITDLTEHDSVQNAFLGCGVSSNVKWLVPNNKGVIEKETFEKALNSTYNSCGFASIMYVNNETGAVNDIKGIAKLCRENRIMLHVDCVQAAGYHPIDVKEIGCNFATISGHKIHGPKGVGALFAPATSENLSLTPIIYGGEEQEFGLRGGTENVAGIVGLGEACKIARVEMEDNVKHINRMKSVFMENFNRRLLQKYSNKIHINGQGIEHTGKVINLRIDGVDAQTLVLAMDECGVCISAGSACRSHESEPSPTLIAMGLTPDEARDSIRISFSKFNTEDEMIKSSEMLATCIEMLAV